MNKTIWSILFFVLCITPIFSQNSHVFNQETPRAFIENKGQFDQRDWKRNSKILFAINENPFYVFFKPDGITYRLDKMIKKGEGEEEFEHFEEEGGEEERVNISELINIEFVNSNPDVEVVSEGELSNYYNYAVKDKNTGTYSSIDRIKGYKKLIYKQVYNKIDLVYEFHPQGGFKYSFILHPGANPKDIKLKYVSSTTKVDDEKVLIELRNDEINIETSLGKIIEKRPFSFYEQSKNEIKSSYKFQNGVLTFDLENYDANKEIIIDPWVASPTFNSSTAVWEVETDAAGNVYAIGGETPMELKKYNSGGTLQWTYTTPWDTSSIWLGTLATDANGNSYVTSGTSPAMHKVNNAGSMVWSSVLGGTVTNSEWWSITFNCDETKLIVGGTDGSLFDFYATIYEIDVTNGNVTNTVHLIHTNLNGGGIGATPEEVRSIASSKNAKYIYLSHNHVGMLSQDFTLCSSTPTPDFQVDNQYNLGYKCENYLPQSQNGGGLKALVANDNYFYTHTGDQIHQWSLTGTLLASAPIPGGGNTTDPLTGKYVVYNCGLDVDDCGNVYAGSHNTIVKFDANLNQLSTGAVSIYVYDVSVNSNGEVIAGGAQSNNSATNRNGRIESVNMGACAQYALVCCDASFCPPAPMCTSDAPINLTAATSGGTWSGTGITDATNGTFDPSVAGVGTFTITYTLPCGTQTQDITVGSCAALSVCVESNGDLTVSGGVGPYTWEYYDSGSSTPITNQTECQSCGYTWQGFPINQCLNGITPVTTCTVPAGWVNNGTGVTNTPVSGYNQMQVTDGNGTVYSMPDITTLSPCSSTCTPPTLTYTQVDVTCQGGADGSINLTVTGSSTYTYSWSNGATTQNLTGLSAGTYIVTVTDQADATCTATTTVTINDGAAPPTVTANAAPSTTVCSGDMVTLTGGGASTYTWDNGVSDGVPFAASTTTTYTVTGTDANTCTNTASVTVTVNNCTTPTASFTISSNNICQGDCITITNTSTGTSGSELYGWQFNGGTPANSTSQNPGSVCYNTAGSYWITLVITDASFNFLDSTGMAVSVNTCSVPVASFTPSQTTICENGCVDFTDNSVGTTGTVTYNWSFPGANTTSSTLQNPTGICYATAGTYTVTLQITDQVGTDDTIMTNLITVNTCTTPTAGFTISSNNICQGDCITITNTTTGTTGSELYAWSFNGGTPSTSTSQTPASVCYNTTGTYWITLVVTDASSNFLDSTGMAVTVNTCNLPVASFTVSQTTLCENDCVNFTDNSTGTTGTVAYNWSFPGANTTSSTQQNPTGICYATAGTYTVTLQITDQVGTDDTIMTNLITVNACGPPVASFTSDTLICEGNCITYTNTTTGGGASYVWTFQGGTPSSSAQTNPTVCYSDSGTYQTTLIATNTYGVDTVSQMVTVQPSPYVDAGFNESINAGVSVNLNAFGSGGSSYVWTPPYGLSCTDCQDPIASPDSSTMYYVTLTNSLGCSSTDSLYIDVTLVEAIGVPSAFSPNGDGVNDVLKVEGAGISKLDFKVYNRYGQLVFEATSQTTTWDGTFNGKPLNPGVFAYVVSYTLYSGEEGVLKGNVTLVK